MKETTDARKAAEEIINKCHFSVCERSMDELIDAMVSFAEFQSRPATLEKVSDEEIEEAADESYSNAAVWYGGYFEPFQAGVRWRESLSEQPEVKPTESEQVEKCDNSHCEDGKVGELSGEIIYCGKCQDRLLESEKISMWWDWALSAWKKGKLRKKYFPSTTNLKPEQIEYIYKAEEALNSLKQ